MTRTSQSVATLAFFTPPYYRRVALARSESECLVAILERPVEQHMADHRAISQWFEYRLAVWKSAADDLKSLEHGKSAPPERVLSAVGAYPEIARDLAIARRYAPNGRLTRFLERTYLHLHRIIFRRPRRLREEVKALFLHDAGRIAHELRSHILWVTTWFVLTTLAGYWLVATYPELIALFASDEMIDRVGSGELWTDDLLNVVPSSVLSVGIFTNNIVVALMTLCLGTLYGLGTIYMIGLNGLMLGAVFAFTAQHSMAGRLFEFVCAHGFVELSVICVAGAAGVSLGEALARPGHRTRTAAFQEATSRGTRLMLVGAAFLVGAGLIEGYVSPDPAFPLPARLALGLGYWAVFLLVMTGRLERLGRGGH